MTQVTVAAINSSSGINQGQWPQLQADNGNLWAVTPEFGLHVVRFWFSTNKGSSWSEDTGADFYQNYPYDAQIYAIGNKVWCLSGSQDPAYSYLQFSWGTFNAGRTAITWSGNSVLWGPTTDYIRACGMVVHTQGSGFRAHLTSTSRYYDAHYYWRLTLDSSGAHTSTDVADNWFSGGTESASGMHDVLLDPVTKDVFLVGVSTGSSAEVWFQKRAYTSATWPAGTARLLDSIGDYSDCLATAFDGDRVVIAYRDPATNHSPTVLERNKADTTTTVRTPPSGISGAVTIGSDFTLQTNAQKDILLVFNDGGTDITDFYKNTFTRLSTTWSGASLVLDTTPNTNTFSPHFIPGTKYFFFIGDAGGGRSHYMLTDMLEVAYTGSASLVGVADAGGAASFNLSGGTVIPRPIVEIAFATDPTSDTPIWEDVSEDVVSFSIRRGRQQELDTIEPGTLSLVLDNDDRDYDPMNTSSPYYPNILPVRRIRVRAVWNSVLYDVFHGYINGWPQEYPSHHRNVVQLDAIDGLGFLSFANLTLNRASELSGARVGGILTSANWPAGDRDIDAGMETFATISEVKGTALSLVQECASTEHGRLFASKGGKITFHSRQRTVTDPPASVGTWNDDDGGPGNAYDDIVPSMDEEKIWNRVTVTREGGTPQVAEDTASQAKFFVRDLSHDDTFLADDAVALSHAQYLLTIGKDPKLRFTSMTVDPRVDSAWDAALDLELGDHIVAEKFATSPISLDVFVDGINHDVSRDDKSWDITYYLTPVPETTDWWVVGESALNVDTRLAF